MVSKEHYSLPCIGARKLLSLMSEPMKRVGRDVFFALLRENQLLIRHLRLKIKIADSRYFFAGTRT